MTAIPLEAHEDDLPAVLTLLALLGGLLWVAGDVVAEHLERRHTARVDAAARARAAEAAGRVARTVEAERLGPEE